MAHGGEHFTSEQAAKLAVSKSKNHRGAVVHNCAIDHELSHTLKTIESIKEKACRIIDFEQRKFLQNLSLSMDDLIRATQEKAVLGREAIGSRISRDDFGTASRNKNTLTKALSFSRSPSLTRLDRSTDQIDELPRSFSDLDLRHNNQSNVPSHLEIYLDSFDSGKEKDKRFPKQRSIEKEAKQSDPYSISSSMKISDSKGTFESCTGKTGLNAWMGKKRNSPKPQRKIKS